MRGVIARCKVYFSSASLYLSVLNFLLVLGTFKQAYGIPLSAWVMIPVGFAGTILVGYLDYRFIRRAETEHANRQNDLKEQLDRIEARL